MTLESNKKLTKGELIINILMYAALMFIQEIVSYTGIVWLFMFILKHINWINYDWGIGNYFICGFILALINVASYIIGEYIHFIKLRKMIQKYGDTTKNID